MNCEDEWNKNKKIVLFIYKKIMWQKDKTRVVTNDSAFGSHDSSFQNSTNQNTLRSGDVTDLLQSVNNNDEIPYDFSDNSYMKGLLNDNFKNPVNIFYFYKNNCILLSRTCNYM